MAGALRIARFKHCSLRHVQFSRSLTFEEVYPDYTFQPRINDNSDELCSPSRQLLREAWKSSGSTEHFALFCIKQNYENSQRRLEQQREWYEQQFAATFQPAPTVNPEYVVTRSTHVVTIPRGILTRPTVRVCVLQERRACQDIPVEVQGVV